jgi:hypothetical protein
MSRLAFKVCKRARCLTQHHYLHRVGDIFTAAIVRSRFISAVKGPSIRKEGDVMLASGRFDGGVL